MTKDPAFLFYSSDFLTGVSDLTMEERGQYITLLCLQHQKGHLSKKAINIATANATADVLAKFDIDNNGNYFNNDNYIDIFSQYVSNDPAPINNRFIGIIYNYGYQSFN